jgi:hypothetical protein
MTDSSSSDLIANYLAAWNEADPDARRSLIQRHWTDVPVYVDPMTEAQGAEAISATIGAVHDQFPGFVFTPVGDVDAHHNQARFHWGLGPAGAEPIVIGFDVVVTDDSGRIDRVLGFLDRVPS